MSNQNRAYFEDLLSQLRRIEEEVVAGGGPKAMAKLKAKGKLSARERVEALLDPGSPRLEIGSLAGWGQYEEEGGCPSGGVGVVWGRIHKRLCVVGAYDPS
ncbi:MAG: acyl-CoA carboxylase subunit beta, partial [Bacteroidota bacterium]